MPANVEKQTGSPTFVYSYNFPLPGSGILRHWRQSIYDVDGDAQASLRRYEVEAIMRCHQPFLFSFAYLVRERAAEKLPLLSTVSFHIPNNLVRQRATPWSERELMLAKLHRIITALNQAKALLLLAIARPDVLQMP
jgi:hypothetical protein